MYKSKFTGPEVDDAIERVLNEETFNTSGRYPEMSVGFSDDLVGRGESIPAEFSFRASGGKSIKDGAARIKRIKGNSVVWNNMADTRHLSNEWTYQNDYMRLIQGHKYLFSRTMANAGIYCIPVIDGQEKYEYSMQLGAYSIIFTSAYDTTPSTTIIYNEKESGSVQLIDLTKMFGAGNEPTTIEEYEARKPIVADEYAYNEGEVIHMNTESIKSVGDNAWDEEWEYNGSYVVGVNSVRVLPNTEYYVSSPDYVVISVYDKNDTLLATHERKNNAFTTPANASYLRLRLSSSYGTTYNNDIMITLVHSGWKQDTDAKYQPYWEDRLMFDKRIKDEFPDGMSKWDMVYNKNGKGYIVHGLGVVEDMSQMDWERNIDGRFQTPIIGALLPPSTDMVGNIMCNRYTTHSADDTYLGLIGIGLDSYRYVWVRDDAYTDAASLKASLAGIPLYYQLAEPTIIEYDEPFNLDYKVADFGTEEIIAEQPSAPISADIIYQFNAVDMIREHELEITELQRIIATMQAQLTSLTSNNRGQ